MQSPKRIFKYFAPERASFLADLRVRYTPLSAFNDPFEGRPEVTGLLPQPDFASMLDSARLSETTRAYDGLTSEAKSRISLEAYSTLVEQETAAQSGEMRKFMENLAPGVMRGLHRKFDEGVGILCLSEVPDSLLMWAHYASSHTGFVVEFDGRHPYFNSPRTPTDDSFRLQRVLYRDTRPSGDLSAVIEEFFLVKSSHWAYEREWRILRPFSAAELTVSADPFPIHLFEIPGDAVSAIILGARSTADLELTVRSTLNTSPALSNVKLRRARPDPSHFVLRLEDE